MKTDKDQRKALIKAGDAFFFGLVNAGDSVAAGIQNGVFGGIKKAQPVKKGYKPYRTVAQKAADKKRTKNRSK